MPRERNWTVTRLALSVMRPSLISFNVDEPIGWVEARLTAKGGDFTLRVVDGTKEKDGITKKLTWRT